jgi:hypothetical protein
MIKKWHAAEGESCFVSFFPLFLRGDHFSLLEINETDGCVYYYDTLERGDKADVRARDLGKSDDLCGANQKIGSLRATILASEVRGDSA